MRKLLNLIIILLFVTACSSAKVNEAKISGAKALGNGMESFLLVEYSSLPSEMNCSAEAAEVGVRVKIWAEEKLGVNKSVMSLSVGGSLAKMACGMIASKFIPELLDRGVDGLPCFKKKFGEYAQEYISNGLCNSIKF